MSNSSDFASKPHSSVSVLRSVASITSQRERDVLARSLVNTLSELLENSCITMYQLLYTEQGIEAVPVAQAPEIAAPSKRTIIVSGSKDFQTVIDTGKEYTRTLDALHQLTIYPVTDKQNTVGLLEISSAQHNGTDRLLASSFLKVYSNYLTILNESETDTLTGLLNRRTFENNLERIIAERATPDTLQRDSDPLKPVRRNTPPDLPHWLAVIDIDHFKRINDEFGHLYGDEVLLLLARIMKRVFRQRDKLFRFGGEEFIVVLDRTDLTNAKNALERFRSEIECYHFPQVGRVTISIGFVRLDKPDVPSSIIGRADQALYYAKKHGRNMVCFYEELIAEGKLTAEQFSDDVELF